MKLCSPAKRIILFCLTIGLVIGGAAFISVTMGTPGPARKFRFVLDGVNNKNITEKPKIPK